MSSWREQAVKALEDSLYPVPQELNGIDRKCALSDNSEKLCEKLDNRILAMEYLNWEEGERQ